MGRPRSISDGMQVFVLCSPVHGPSDPCSFPPRIILPPSSYGSWQMLHEKRMSAQTNGRLTLLTAADELPEAKLTQISNQRRNTIDGSGQRDRSRIEFLADKILPLRSHGSLPSRLLSGQMRHSLRTTHSQLDLTAIERAESQPSEDDSGQNLGVILKDTNTNLAHDFNLRFCFHESTAHLTSAADELHGVMTLLPESETNFDSRSEDPTPLPSPREKGECLTSPRAVFSTSPLLSYTLQEIRRKSGKDRKSVV